MRSDYEHWLPNHRWQIAAYGVFHAVCVIDGGYLMDNECAVVCTGDRLLDERHIVNGIPDCLLCWAKVLT